MGLLLAWTVGISTGLSTPLAIGDRTPIPETVEPGEPPAPVDPCAPSTDPTIVKDTVGCTFRALVEEHPLTQLTPQERKREERRLKRALKRASRN